MSQRGRKMFIENLFVLCLMVGGISGILVIGGIFEMLHNWITRIDEDLLERANYAMMIDRKKRGIK